MTQEVKRIGVLTSGGDCSGLNTAIRAVTFSAITRGWEVYGIHNATDGLFVRPMWYQKLTMADFEFPFATLGGTMLGTNNSGNPHRVPREDGGQRADGCAVGTGSCSQNGFEKCADGAFD